MNSTAGKRDQTSPLDIGPIAVTGGTGYLGSVVVRHLLAQGMAVRSLTRSFDKPSRRGLEFAPFDLADRPRPEVLAGMHGLVHAAYDFRPSSWDEIYRINVEGSRQIFEAARDAGVQDVVYVSSAAAFPGGASLYCRAKLLIERAALDAGANVIRPGLVWGEQGGAIFASVKRMANRLPILPLFVPDDVKLLLIHEDDLAASVEAALLAIHAGSPPSCFVAAAKEGVDFRSLLEGVVTKSGRRPRFVQVPWRLLWAGLRTLEIARLPTPFRADSVTSLVHADPSPFGHAQDIAALGIHCRPFSFGNEFPTGQN